ncbi:MAG TPA: hypothetical protein VIS06_01450, partial [Mycobacteriales bacterium]
MDSRAVRRGTRGARSIGGVPPAALTAAVLDAVRRTVQSGDLAVTPPSEVTVERPRVREHGDYATNVALRLAG